MEYYEQIAAFINQHQNVLFYFARVASALAIIAACALTCAVTLFMPLRIRFGMVRIDPILKLIVAGLVVAWMCAATWTVIWFPFIVIAKLAILNIMIAVTVLCWVLLLTWPQISAGLSQVQQECELATNLTFLQAEMARAQLEQLNDRLQKALVPEEREATEIMFRTISPLVSMFLKRERSVIKWSMAAVDLGRNAWGYFFPDKKNNNSGT